MSVELMKIEITRINNTLKRVLDITGERDEDMKEVLRFGLFNLISLEKTKKEAFENDSDRFMEMVAMFIDNLSKIYIISSGRQFYCEDANETYKNLSDTEKIRPILMREIYDLMEVIVNY